MAPARYTDLTLYRRLWRQARPYRPHIGCLFLLSLLSTPLALLTPLPLKIAVDSVIGSQPLPGYLAVLPQIGSRDYVLYLAIGILLGSACPTPTQFAQLPHRVHPLPDHGRASVLFG